MKIFFNVNLKGKDWWKPVLLFAYSYAIFVGFDSLGSFIPVLKLSFALSSMSFLLYFIILIPIFYTILFKIFCTHTSLKDKNVSFTGSKSELLKKYVKGTLLSIITLGIYWPWFYKNVVQYFMRHTFYEDKNATFNAKPKKLLLYYVLFVILPLILFIAALVAIILVVGEENLNVVFPTTIVTFIFVFFLMMFFMAFTYKWLLDFSFNNKNYTSSIKIIPTSLFILGQLFLVIITLGIYTPFANLKIYRYLLSKIQDTEKPELACFGYDGGIARTGWFCWGQILLAIITVGIYTPWASAKIISKVLNQVWVDASIIE